MRRKIRVLKLSFVAAALLLTVLLFWQATGSEDRLVIESPTADVNQGVQASTVTVAPHYFGEDDRGRRYDVRAERAKQTTADDNNINVILYGLAAVANTTSDAAWHFEAGEGYFTRSTGEMNLFGGVRLSGMGYEVSTTALTGNIKEKTAKNASTVTITGLGGTLTGGRFELNERVLQLSGGVRARIWPTRIRGAQ